MTDLAAFLLEQIAADEAAASRGRRHNDASTYASDNYGCLLVDPAHVLAVCAAHRAIVEEWVEFRTIADATAADAPLSRAYAQSGVVKGLERAVTHLASIYADRDGWRDEWAL